ncbi:hypothetical protein [Prevotella histicola]|uniref:hypothetical protein n=1 Tax=Prevotella histicola TaxID=470565 RepID=UPI0028DB5E73|nr:hypothetical protein [Prevotella histicola]
MDRITVGLDFGTHQTKVCIENKADVNNPEYSFFPFKDLEGNDNYILPSIVQINSDNTLSYGFVDEKRAKYGKKFIIGEMPKFPQKIAVTTEDLEPMPTKPAILNSAPPTSGEQLARYKKAQKLYDTQLNLWRNKSNSLKKKHECAMKDAEATYQAELKEWYDWQNTSQVNYRMIYRYFKQDTFSDYKWNCSLSSSYLSIWYICYIIFCLEEKYGQNFAIQMGIPTGSDSFVQKKQKAVSILLTAYHLVEKEFKNDLEKFLSTPVDELEKMTKLIPFSEEKKQEYGLLVFPEAYAALKPITAQNKIETGMNIMVDIGGGTTDITFFTIENSCPKIYDYSSISYGLNYIIEKANPHLKDKFDIDLNLSIIDSQELSSVISSYYQKLRGSCGDLVEKLFTSFPKTGYPTFKLTDALKKRPIVYSGGGSTYDFLRKPVFPFTDVTQISPKIWQGMNIKEISKFIDVCPIVSTALGLAISEIHDDVELATINDIFKPRQDT